MVSTHQNGIDADYSPWRLMDVASDGLVVLDAQSRVVYANRAFEAICGTQPQGSVLTDLLDPGARDKFATALSVLLSGAQASCGLDLPYAQSGSAGRLELRLSHEGDGDAGYVYGCARVKRDAAASADQLRALRQSEHVALVVSELESGRLLEVNRAFERQLGVSAESVIGKTVVELGIVSEAQHLDYVERIQQSTDTVLRSVPVPTACGRVEQMLLCVSKIRGFEPELVLTVGLDITAYVEAEARADETEQRFRAVCEQLQECMYFFDATGRFLDVNRAACDYLGYSRAELMQLRVADVVALPDWDLAQASAELNTKRRKRFESVHRAKDGSLHPVEVTMLAIPHRGGSAMALIARDLAEVRQAQAEVTDARDRMQAILQTLPDLLFEIDERGVILGFHSSRTDLLTRPVDEFMHRNVNELVSPEIAASIMRGVREALEHGLASGVEYTLDDGRWFELSAARRAVVQGNSARVVALVREITERKHREMELKRSNDELLRFTYTVSHDLKSPLVTIGSFAGLLRQDLAKRDIARVERDLGFIDTAANRMGQLLDDLLALSRVGRRVEPHQRVSLQELVSEACDLVAGPILNNGARIEVTQTPVWLVGDRTRLLEVFQNLIDNAVKFAKPQEAAHVTISVEPGDLPQEVVICVRDAGIGIDPRHQHKLFGLFEKLQPDASGTGIGLALIKRIVEVHGGRVWIESAGEGQGTCVRLSLPNTTLEPGT